MRLRGLDTYAFQVELVPGAQAQKQAETILSETSADPEALEYLRRLPLSPASCVTLRRPLRRRGGPRTTMPIPIDKAIQMVRTAHAQAAQLDIAVTAVVVDEGGRLIALGRMDRARPITVEMATNKAYTAASFQQPTDQLTGLAGQTWFQSLVVSSNGRITAGGGALPIVEGGNVVGAIAVAGGTDEQDQRCCEAALATYA
jgi:uncharacterized protein GlcG (DUF336 family)